MNEGKTGRTLDERVRETTGGSEEGTRTRFYVIGEYVMESSRFSVGAARFGGSGSAQNILESGDGFDSCTLNSSLPMFTNAHCQLRTRGRDRRAKTTERESDDSYT